MSDGKNDYDEEALPHLTSTIPPEITEGEMSQVADQNDSEKDLHRLTSTIAAKIEEGAKKTDSFFSSACICRVPERLRKLKPDAYTPSIIAIGPLHREDEHLQTPLQHVKMSYTKHLLSRLTAGMEDRKFAEQKKFMVLHECLVEMKASRDDANKCYAAEVTLDEEMMLVDGCFILEYFYRRFNNDISEAQKVADPIYGIDLVEANISFDLILLENQIPLYVLEKLFELTIARIPNSPNKDMLLIDYVCQYLSSISMNFSRSLFDPNAKHNHILHILHDGYLRCDLGEEEEHDGYLCCDLGEEEEQEEAMPSASELGNAGVKFVPSTASTTNNMFKIQFIKPKGLSWFCQMARFEIPPLVVDDATESFLRNLIAFEQCCPVVSQHVSSYATVMDMLINSDKDVQVLEKARVIHNCLGASKDATDLFNNLTKEIILRSYFSETCKKATHYSKQFWPKHMAQLRRTYFASPWTFIAFCIAFIVFVMSVISFVLDFLEF